MEGTLKYIAINGSIYLIGKNASSSESGIVKLYNTYEASKNAEDGTYAAKTVYDAISALDSSSELTVKKDGIVTSDPVIGADNSTYGIFQGNTEIFKISVAKDMVVSDGQVITADGTEKTTTNGNISANLTPGEKYIMLQLANSTKLLYISVNSLYKDYTFTDTSEIDFTDNNNTITAEIKSGSIAKSKLSSSVQASLDLADSALQNHQDISGKADKVSGSTSGNFAGLDANGNLTDSGSKASDFLVAGSYKTTLSEVTNPSTGNSTTTYEFISGITQNTNGVITATKESVRSASSSLSGLMSSEHYNKLSSISASVSGDTLFIVSVEKVLIKESNGTYDSSLDGISSGPYAFDLPVIQNLSNNYTYSIEYSGQDTVFNYCMCTYMGSDLLGDDWNAGEVMQGSLTDVKNALFTANDEHNHLLVWPSTEGASLNTMSLYRYRNNIS